MCNEKRLEILEELLNDLDNSCHNSIMNGQIEALSSAIADLKCVKVPDIRFSMQNVKDSDEQIWITDSSFKGAFAYWLYYMCLGHPRKFETIMSKLIKVIEEQFTETVITTRMISIAYKNVYAWIESIVQDIPEILELNLTTNEFNAGITLATRDNADSIVITSAFSVIPEGEDFVDIDALIQNITYSLCKEAAES